MPGECHVHVLLIKFSRLAKPGARRRTRDGYAAERMPRSCSCSRSSSIAVAPFAHLATSREPPASETPALPNGLSTTCPLSTIKALIDAKQLAAVKTPADPPLLEIGVANSLWQGMDMKDRHGLILAVECSRSVDRHMPCLELLLRRRPPSACRVGRDGQGHRRALSRGSAPSLRGIRRGAPSAVSPSRMPRRDLNALIAHEHRHAAERGRRQCREVP